MLQQTDYVHGESVCYTKNDLQLVLHLLNGAT